MSGFRVLIISAAIAAFSAISGAQTPAEEPAQERGSGTTGMMDQGDMRGLMESCGQRFEAMMRAIENARASSEEAIQSKDPARTRAAMQEVQDRMRELEEHTAMCQDTMERMAQDMRGADRGPQGMQQAGDGGCDVACRGMMEMEMNRWAWMTPLAVVTGLLATAALALLVVLEVLWVRHWLHRLRGPSPAARS